VRNVRNVGNLIAALIRIRLEHIKEISYCHNDLGRSASTIIWVLNERLHLQWCRNSSIQRANLAFPPVFNPVVLEIAPRTYPQPPNSDSTDPSNIGNKGIKAPS